MNDLSGDSDINWTEEGIDKMFKLLQAKKEGRFDEVFKELYSPEENPDQI